MNPEAGFELHPRLAADTTFVGDLPLCRVLLAKEEIGPWLILVPRRSELREIHHLSETDRLTFWNESAQVSGVLERLFAPDKLNVAALGNMVPQLHVHHVARFASDAAWPAPIWGNTPGQPRPDGAQSALASKIGAALGFAD